MFLICKTLGPLHPRMSYVKLGWNWPTGSGDFQIFLFRSCFPWKKCTALYINKLQFPSPKGALCQVWSKFAQLFWRRFCMLHEHVMDVHYSSYIHPPLCCWWSPQFDAAHCPLSHNRSVYLPSTARSARA